MTRLSTMGISNFEAADEFLIESGKQVSRVALDM